MIPVKLLLLKNYMIKTERLTLRLWTMKDLDSLLKYGTT